MLKKGNKLTDALIEYTTEEGKEIEIKTTYNKERITINITEWNDYKPHLIYSFEGNQQEGFRELTRILLTR